MTFTVSGGTAIVYAPYGKLTKAFTIDLEAQEVEVTRGHNSRQRIRIAVQDIVNLVDPRGTTYTRTATDVNF